MTFKKIIGKIHLWLGLSSGIIVFVVGLTGCLIVFEEEISRLLHYGVYQTVENTAETYAPPSEIFRVADSALAGKKIARAYYTVFMEKENVDILWALDSSRTYHAVLQHPSTAEIAGHYDYMRSFFTIMTYIHTSLGIGETGTLLISWATLIFVVLMITGLILWKPASRKGYKQRFRIKWNASGKRLNYDLHNVLGFYMSWIAIFIALSGLVWSFEWFDHSVQWIANGGKKVATTNETFYSDTSQLSEKPFPMNDYVVMDSLFNHHLGNRNQIHAIRVYRPSSPADILRITIETKQGEHYDRADDYIYDQYSGRLLQKKLFSELSNGEKLRRLNYYVHVGSIGGLAGKLLAFFASMIAASLPITGFIIWRGRRRRKVKGRTIHEFGA